MKADEVVKVLRWLAKVRICQVEAHEECPKCEFHGICTDPDLNESICEQIKVFNNAADLLEQQAEIIVQWQNTAKVAVQNEVKLRQELEQITKDRDQWRVVAEASRDVIQPKLRAEIAELKASQPVRCGNCNITIT